MKTCKKLRDKAKRSNTSFEDVLFVWRATPSADGASPAFLLFGFHPRRPGLPHLKAHTDMARDEFALRREEKNTKDFLKKKGKHLNMLQVGDRILLQSRTDT